MALDCRQNLAVRSSWHPAVVAAAYLRRRGIVLRPNYPPGATGLRSQPFRSDRAMGVPVNGSRHPEWDSKSLDCMGTGRPEGQVIKCSLAREMMVGETNEGSTILAGMNVQQELC